MYVAAMSKAMERSMATNSRFVFRKHIKTMMMVIPDQISIPVAAASCAKTPRLSKDTHGTNLVMNRQPLRKQGHLNLQHGSGLSAMTIAQMETPMVKYMTILPAISVGGGTGKCWVLHASMIVKATAIHTTGSRDGRRPPKLTKAITKRLRITPESIHSLTQKPIQVDDDPTSIKRTMSRTREATRKPIQMFHHGLPPKSLECEIDK
jgi:hypothetical protein